MVPSGQASSARVSPPSEEVEDSTVLVDERMGGCSDTGAEGIWTGLPSVPWLRPWGQSPRQSRWSSPGSSSGLARTDRRRRSKTTWNANTARSRPTSLSRRRSGRRWRLRCGGGARAFYRYIDLTNQEVFLRSQRRIRPETWASWREGIAHHLRRPAFKAAWDQIKAEAVDDFPELRRLEQGGFTNDPAGWSELPDSDSRRPKDEPPPAMTRAA